MAAPEITFGIRRVRTSAITQSATKMTTVATVRDCINSLHFSVQRRPDVRGAAVRPPLSRFHPTHGRARVRRQLRRRRSRSEPCSRACRHLWRSRSPPQRRSCRSPPERCRTRPGPGLRHRQPISSLALSCSPPFRGPAPSSLLGLATFRPVPAHTTENPSPTSRLGRCRGGVDHVLSPTPQRADIAGDDDGYDNRDDADGRQGNPVLREILGGLLAKQPRQKIQHPSPSLAASWADRTGRTHPNRLASKRLSSWHAGLHLRHRRAWTSQQLRCLSGPSERWTLALHLPCKRALPPSLVAYSHECGSFGKSFGGSASGRATSPARRDVTRTFLLE